MRLEISGFRFDCALSFLKSGTPVAALVTLHALLKISTFSLFSRAISSRRRNSCNTALTCSIISFPALVSLIGWRERSKRAKPKDSFLAADILTISLYLEQSKGIIVTNDLNNHS